MFGKAGVFFFLVDWEVLLETQEKLVLGWPNAPLLHPTRKVCLHAMNFAFMFVPLLRVCPVVGDEMDSSL